VRRPRRARDRFHGATVPVATTSKWAATRRSRVGATPAAADRRCGADTRVVRGARSITFLILRSHRLNAFEEKTNMLGITEFGLFHTAISLLAVAAAVIALLRHHEIALASASGRAFVWLTVASCLTGLCIFRHGSFGPPHALAILTLIVLGVAALAERRRLFGGYARHVAAVGFLLSFFFHFIPGFTETLTRVPVGQPYVTGPEDPRLQALIGGAFVVYLIGAVWQVLRLRRRGRIAPMPSSAR
jgi:uncharacterized membrane protein